MKKRIFALVMVLVLALAFAGFAEEESADTRVFDYAGLFSEEQAEELRASIIDFQENTGYDFAVLVTYEDLGDAVDYQQICDDFYVEKSLGLGMNETAILCFLDLYGDGYYYVSVYGDLKNLMVSADIEYLANQGMEYFMDGDFVGGFTWTTQTLSQALQNIGTMDETTRVFDYAGILTDDEVTQLEAVIAAFREASGHDFLYLSTYEEMEGNEDGDYMMEFYKNHGFGDGNDRSGAIIYLDMYYGSYYIQNFGNMDTYVTQDELNVISQSCGTLMGEGKILDAVLQVLSAYTAQFDTAQ